ncbi:MAG: hypothetical protein M3237_04985 [Actinomycetota bacterium]|nr:hypothetical protein [Actinomycetota bacterium]
MAQRVVLHAGLMKSGTSYLQDRLFLNRDRLAERGLLVPGPARRDQALAVQDVLGRHAAASQVRGKWSELLREIQGHDGDAVISMEFLGPVAPERIAGVVEALGTPVHVVLTVRDLGRVVPAMWQERLKNGGTAGWREYVDGLAGGDKAARGFWWQQGAARIVRNWADAVGPERVTVVTLPLPGVGPGLLWSRFCAAAGVPGDGCEDVPPANTSLDVASAVVLLAVNRTLAERGGVASDFQLMLKFRLAKQAMGSRTGGRPIGFEPPPWLEERADAIVAKIRARGVNVVGDLAELTPLVVPGDDPEDVDAEAALAAAVDALVGITGDYFRRVSARGTHDQP